MLSPFVSALLTLSLVLYGLPVSATEGPQASLARIQTVRDNYKIEFVRIDDKLDHYFEREANKQGRKAIGLIVRFLNNELPSATLSGHFFLVDQQNRPSRSLDLEEVSLPAGQPVDVNPVFYIPKDKSLSFSLLWVTNEKFPNGKYVSFLVPLTPGVQATFSGESRQQLIQLQKSAKKAAEAEAIAEKQRFEAEAKRLEAEQMARLEGEREERARQAKAKEADGNTWMMLYLAGALVICAMGIAGAFSPSKR